MFGAQCRKRNREVRRAPRNIDVDVRAIAAVRSNRSKYSPAQRNTQEMPAIRTMELAADPRATAESAPPRFFHVSNTSRK